MNKVNEPIEQIGPLPPPAAGQLQPENKELPAHLERHIRKCQICRHPDREEMEQEYEDWVRVSRIARHYKVDDSSLHRHLTAVGLVAKRRNNVRVVLERILERGAEKPISGNTIIRAVKAYTCLRDGNKWVEPQRKVIYIHTDAASAEAVIRANQ
jgi:hypothetical protein